MKAKKSLGVKFKIWIYFIIFAVVMVLLAWLFAVIFVNVRYDAMRKEAISGYGDEIIQSYRENDLDAIKQTPVKYGIDFFIFRIIEVNSEQVAQTILSSDSGGGNLEIVPLSRFGDFFAVLEQNHHKAAAYFTGQDKNLIVYGNVIDAETDPVYFYVTGTLMVSPLTQRVLTEHVVVFALIAVALGSLLALICSMRFVEPIISLSDTAREVSLGKLTANFDAKGYSEVEELTEYLNTATKELKQTEMLRKDFIANVSHDLRTPLTMVKAYAEMIRDISGNDETVRNEHTQIIIDETDRLSVLVNDILQLSRLQSGSVEIKKEKFNFSELVEKVVLHFRVLEDTKNYVFQTNIRKNLMINGDPKRIEQVIYNLIANAVNYTGKNKLVVVDVQVKDGKASFQVSDTGKGIEPELIENIWEKYYRLNKHYAIKGSGLGLSIVKAILDDHGYRYGVDSVLNQGTTFWFYAPLVRRDKRVKYYQALKDPYTED